MCFWRKYAVKCVSQKHIISKNMHIIVITDACKPLNIITNHVVIFINYLAIVSNYADVITNYVFCGRHAVKYVSQKHIISKQYNIMHIIVILCT